MKNPVQDVKNWHATTSNAWNKTVVIATAAYPLLWAFAILWRGLPACPWNTSAYPGGYPTWLAATMLLGFTAWGVLVWLAKNLIQAATFRALMDSYQEWYGHRS